MTDPDLSVGSPNDIDPADMQGCEHCDKSFAIEDMHSMGDIWICEGWYVEWKAVFDACEHQWEDEESEFGEPGKYCNKCCGFVLDPEPVADIKT